MCCIGITQPDCAGFSYKKITHLMPIESVTDLLRLTILKRAHILANREGSGRTIADTLPSCRRREREHRQGRACRCGRTHSGRFVPAVSWRLTSNSSSHSFRTLGSTVVSIPPIARVRGYSAAQDLPISASASDNMKTQYGETCAGCSRTAVSCLSEKVARPVFPAGTASLPPPE